MYTNPVPESFDRRKNNAPLLYICNFILFFAFQLFQPFTNNLFYSDCSETKKPERGC